jgi:spore germination cell wall hydrolase CwlJ-like protein
MRRFAFITALVLPLCASSNIARSSLTVQQVTDMNDAALLQNIQDQLSQDKTFLDTLRAAAPTYRSALRCLTDNIYYEAGTEPFEGKLAVAQVTMNRVANGFGGDTVCAVVYAKSINTINGKKEAAFSWTLGAKWRAKGPINWRVWDECKRIAKQVLAGRLHSDIIGSNVQYYHAVYVTPGWVDQHKFVAQIGNQDFYE